jgi:hypothetical protein
LIKSWRKHTDLRPDNDDCDPAPKFHLSYSQISDTTTHPSPSLPPSLAPSLTAHCEKILRATRLQNSSTSKNSAHILHSFSHNWSKNSSLSLASVCVSLSRSLSPFSLPPSVFWPRRCLQRNLRHARNKTRCQEKRFKGTKSSKDFGATIIGKNLLVELFQLLASESK